MIKSLSSYIIFNLKLYGFREVTCGTGIFKFILSSILTFFEGFVTILSFSLSFFFNIKFLILVLLNDPSLWLIRTSTLKLFSLFLTIILMFF